MLLGLGGAPILRAVGFEVTVDHMNEGHSALLGVELMRRFAYRVDDLRPGEAMYDLPRGAEPVPIHFPYAGKCGRRECSYCYSQRMVRRYATEAYLR